MSAGYADGRGSTWALKATRVVSDGAGRWTGRGVRIAVLDSGIDLAHESFAARLAATKSFVRGKTVQDTLGHGTHCAGVAGGNCDAHHLRYGVAYGADLYIGRVFDDDGNADGDRVVAAIDWAISSGCEIIALPLGSIEPLEPDPFEEAGARALAANCLAIAAAGNGRLRAAAQPASAASVLSVGAVDSWLRPATFGPRGRNQPMPNVDVVAPGVDIYGPTIGGGYSMRSGTSMAAACVAGIAALWAEATGMRGEALWRKLVDGGQRLPAGSGNNRTIFATAPR